MSETAGKHKYTFITVIFESLGTLIVSLALTRFLYPEIRGQYSTIIASIFLISFLGNSVHNRAIYFRGSEREINFLKTVCTSLIISSSIFSLVGSFLFYKVGDYSKIHVGIILSGSLGVSIYSFIGATYSTQNSHKKLLNFSKTAFLIQITNAALVLLFKNQILALLFFLLSLWIPICLTIWSIYNRFGKSISIITIPSFDFIKTNFLPRFLSLPVYISIFDSLKVDILLCNYYLGFEMTGNYVVATTLSVSLLFLYRFLFLSNLNKTKFGLKNAQKNRSRNILFIFFISAIAFGLFFAYFLPFIFEFIFPKGYKVDRLDFILIWLGNMFYWGRRLVGDIYMKLGIDKWVGISEIVGALLFVILLKLNAPRNLYEFSVTYLISLFCAFTTLFVACRQKLKSS